MGKTFNQRDDDYAYSKKRKFSERRLKKFKKIREHDKQLVADRDHDKQPKDKNASLSGTSQKN